MSCKKNNYESIFRRRSLILLRRRLPRPISTDTIGRISTAEYRLCRQVQWNIEDFPDLPKHDLYCAQSPEFQFEAQDWALRLWPNFNKKCLEVNLLTKGPFEFDTLRAVRFSVGLKRNDGTYFIVKSKEGFSLEDVTASQKEKSRFPATMKIPRSLLHNEEDSLLAGGCLMVYCILSVVRGTEIDVLKQVKDDTPVLTKLGQNLKDLYTTGKDSDVTIKVKDKTFAAHRIILGARTPVLAAMFRHDMAEKEAGIISVEDCDPEAFSAFLQFVYSESVEGMTAENAMSVYYIADKYDLPDLKELCAQFMSTNLTADNICNVLSIASLHDEKELLEAAAQFFQENAKEVFSSPQWAKFMVENASEAREIIIRYAETK